jgi:predicted anti-sigma-YlaC factor YlaD
MSADIHEQARELIALAGGKDDLSHAQQNWLRVHLQNCAPCRDYAELARQTLSTLRSRSLAADFALVQATQLRMRARAAELRRQQERRWLVSLSCVFVGLSAAMTTPMLWLGLHWMGARVGISDWAWQASFAFFGIVPALVVSALLLAHGTHLVNNEERSRG